VAPSNAQRGEEVWCALPVVDNNGDNDNHNNSTIDNHDNNDNSSNNDDDDNDHDHDKINHKDTPQTTTTIIMATTQTTTNRRYYMARLGDDLISLAEKPQLVTVDPNGHDVWGPYGKQTDDKPCLHYTNGACACAWVRASVRACVYVRSGGRAATAAAASSV
jgi:hypothetical protein